MPSTFSLGGVVPIEDPVISGVYPLCADYDLERRLANNYVIHKISLKKEQRILRKRSTQSWRVLHKTATQAELQELVDFYNDHRSPTQLFYFYDLYESGGEIDLTGVSTTGRYVCRFADTELSDDAVMDHLFSVGVELIQVNVSTTPILCQAFWTYTTDRYPTDFNGGQGVLDFYSKADLTHEADLVPLVFVRTHTGTLIKVSDRLVEVDQNFGPTPTELDGIYLPRLLDWEVEQEIDASDSGRFVMDNADGAWDALAESVNLERAELRFFVHKRNLGGLWFHNLWRGYIADWRTSREDGTFSIECEGGIHGLKRTMPRRTGATVCPWEFDDGKECPYSTSGSGGDPDFCDKGLDTPDGCTAHGMTNFFGGLSPKPITITGKLNDTGVGGFFRKSYSSTSTPIKTIQGEVIPIVYGDGRQIIEAKIFETRDESEFFVAAGVFSEGLVGEVGQVLLDGQTMHPGFDPIVALGDIGQNVGTHIDSTFRSSATAFVSVRRVDEVGFKNPNDTHALLVEVLKGVPGSRIWWWTGPFAAAGDVVSSNPVHIAFNFVLRALGVHRNYAANAMKDNVIEIDRFIEAESFCDTLVPSLVGAGNEKRFEFRGRINEAKPAIDHLRDILACAPIDLVYSYGLLAFKPRKDDITVASPRRITFEHLENIIHGSFRAYRREARFNEVKVLYSDIDLDFQENSVTVYDETAQKRIGFHDLASLETPKKPLVKQTQLNAIGLFSKSQVTRLATQLLREELGGATQAEQLDAREVELEVPLIGLAVELSDISPVVHPDLPDGSAYVRWKRWHLGSDWKVALRGSTVTASMYGGTPPQLASTPEGTPVPGIPGGSQGSDGTENDLESLAPPVLWLISQTYRTAQVGVTCGETPDIAITEQPPVVEGQPTATDPEAPTTSEPPPTTIPPPVVVVLPPATPPATGLHTYYISKTGSDAHPGTIDQPFLTLGKALSKLVAGDVLFYRGGSYGHNFSNNYYTIPAGTSWSVPITIAAYQNETVTIRSVGLGQSRIQYLIFQGLIIDGEATAHEGIWLGYGTHHCRFVKCKVTHAGGQGVLIPHTGDHHHEFLGCEIYNCGFWIFGVGHTGMHNHGVYCSGADNLFDGCLIHDNSGYGFHGYNGYGGSDRSSRNVLRNSKIYRNGITLPSTNSAFGVLIGSGDDGHCYNNLIYGNRGGINVMWGNPVNMKIEFNTIFGNGGTPGLDIGSQASGTKVRNNISYGNSGTNWINRGSSSLTESNNLFGINPLFVNSSASDFHLQAGSPAINAGLAIAGITTDKDGVTRGTPPDIGAYEKV